MVLSYIEAFHAMQSGTISWNGYLDALLAPITATGRWHEDDDTEGMHWDLSSTDPFGYAMFCWMKRIERISGHDVKPIQEVFAAYREGSMMELRRKLAALSPELEPASMRGCLAFLALKERRSNVLELCLRQGSFPFEAYFAREADRVDRREDPQTFRILEESEFRRLYPRRVTSDEIDEDSEEDPAAVFDEGGEYPVDW